MEPLSIMGAIFKVAQEIAKAAKTARRNRSRCLELAERARNVGDLLRDSKAAKDTATRRRVLGRLSEALGDALKLVQSCRRGGLISRLLAAGRDAGRFDDVERKINNCLMDLGIANDARLERQVNQLAARGNHPGTNAKAGSQKKINHNTKEDVAMNGNKSSTAAAGKRRNKGRYAGDLLHDSQVDKDTPTRTRVLVSLSEALGDALRLVESCRRGCLFRRLLAASRDAGRFGNVDRRITNCLLELGIANDAHREKQFIQITANTRAGSEMEINVRNAKKKDVAKNDNKSSTTAAARKTRNKRRRARGKGKQTKQKAAGPPPPPLPCGGEAHYPLKRTPIPAP